jgi:hypothetical protein
MIIRICLLLLFILPLSGCGDGDGSATSEHISHVANHSEIVGGETIRCSAINSTQIPDEVIARFGISGDSATGVLSCTSPNDAELQASYRVVGTASQAIELEEVLDESYPTWIGTYDDTAMLPLNFTITVNVGGQPAATFEFDTKSS